MNKFTTRWTLIIIVVALSSTMLINACKKTEGDKPHSTTPIAFVLPKGFPMQHYQFTNNPLTQEGFDLGKNYFMMAVFPRMVIFPVLPATSKLLHLPILNMT